MPVWVSTDESLDKNKAGERRRHITADCPTYLAEVPTKDRSPAKGRPNTVKLQEQTVRCENDKCWLEWEKEQSSKKTRTKSGASAKGAATTATTKVGGKAAEIAQRAKAARQKPKAAAATAA